MSLSPPPPLGSDWKAWGERLVSTLRMNKNKLESITSGESAARDGVIMWDRVLQKPVISINGVWRSFTLDP